MNEIKLEGLSDQAKAVASMFGMMSMGLREGQRAKGTVSFNMDKGITTPAMNAALIELMQAGVIVRELADNGYPESIAYRPLKDCGPAFDWLGKNRDNPNAKVTITENVTEATVLPIHQLAELNQMGGVTTCGLPARRGRGLPAIPKNRLVTDPNKATCAFCKAAQQ